MEEPSGSMWTYANNWRVTTLFLGLSMSSFCVGALIVIAVGSDGSLAAVTFLTIGIFFAVFSVLVFVPRVVRRGSVSYSLYSRQDMDEVERVVRDAVSATGGPLRVAIERSRRERPARTLVADGSGARFRLEAARHPQQPRDGPVWTEVIQLGVAGDDDEGARRLRERISEELAGRPPVP